MRVPDLWVPPATPFTAGDVGRSAHVLARAVADGRVVRLRNGVFIAADAMPTDPTDRHLLLGLAHQRTCPHLVASHGTAALAHGLLVPRRVDVTAAPPRFIAATNAARRSLTRPRVAVRPLPVRDVVSTSEDLRVTSVARSAVDVASEHDLAGALVVLDSAARGIALQLSRGRWLRAVPDRVLQACREPLTAALDSVPRLTRSKVRLAIAWTDPRRESATESMSAAAFITAGLPPPNLQHPLNTDAGVYYGDFAWPEFGVVGEADGLTKYDSAEVARERRRQRAIEDVGWRVERWLYEEVATRPEAVAARVAQALRERGWPG
ncbi:MAG: DUF559 domain-containing protein [Candidatus Nanopelagicales bacterium]